MHGSLLVAYYGRRVTIHCGEDWGGEVRNVKPEAFVISR
jgi:hypothetical protein